MRRHDREVTDINEIYEIMRKCDVCRLAFHNGKFPYIIPMNFGVQQNDNRFTLYFHCAKAGTKLDLIRENPDAAFEMDCSHRLLLGERACDSTMEYESVCGNGTIRILTQEEKESALTILMEQYQSGKRHEFGHNELMAVEVLELKVNEITGKRLKKN